MNVALARKLICLPLVAAAGILAGCSEAVSSSGDAGGPPPVPKVQTVEVTKREMPWGDTYAGRAVGARRVEVRSRVSGILLERDYVEGSVVKEGDVLFRIDPDSFIVQLNRGKAEKNRAEARLRQAKRDLRRIEELVAANAVSERERDTAQSEYELAQADLAVTEAVIQEAELLLGYTTVVAPVAGVTSVEALPQGSLVDQRDLLTTITQLDPIHVTFSISESDPLFLDLFQWGTNGNGNSRRTATLHTDRGGAHPESGYIDFTESALDVGTGSIRIRAVFPNSDHRILPGQFVRVSIDDARLPMAAIIPDAATATGPEGPIVYVVGADETVEARRVVLGPLVGNEQLVYEGLAEGDRIISRGLIHIRPGMSVRPVPAQL